MITKLVQCALCALSIALAPRTDATRELRAGNTRIELPPVPSPDRPAQPTAPASSHLDRDSAIAERFTAQGQSVVYGFEAEAGELSLFGLESWGWARGWRSSARVRVLDAHGNVLLDELRAGPSVYHHVSTFVAPASGNFRYELTAAEQCFRYRVTRHSSYVPHAGDTPLALGQASLLHGYLAEAKDEARYTLELSAGEEVWIKVLNSDLPARAERRAYNPPRLGSGSFAGFMYQGFVLDVRLDGAVLVERTRSVLLRAPRAGTYEVHIHTAHAHEGPGGGGLFDLELRRRVEKVALQGTVADEEGTPLAGVELTFFHGIDRDQVGTVRSASDGTYLLQVPVGRYRVLLHDAERGTSEQELQVPGARDRNLVLAAAH
jgi:hypothetical protein